MEYLDFNVEIKEANDAYTVDFRSPPGGDPQRDVRPSRQEVLQVVTSMREAFGSSLTHSRGIRPAPEGASGATQRERHQRIEELGNRLFSLIFPDDVGQIFDRSRDAAAREEKGLRVRIIVRPPELLSVPWELLYNPFARNFVALDERTPLVRGMQALRPTEPLPVKPPLQILAMGVTHPDLGDVDIDRERRFLEKVIAGLPGFAELTWVTGTRWRDLELLLNARKYHVFHFIGHGRFAEADRQGSIALVDNNAPQWLDAEKVGQLLAPVSPPLKLVVLNACEGATGDASDAFSSVAAALIGKGIPAVLAMQHTIADNDAIAFAADFYQRLTHFEPIDQATALTRLALNIDAPDTLAWATPVLFMQTRDGALFQDYFPETLTKPGAVPPRLGQLSPAPEPPRETSRLQDVLRSMERVSRLANVLRQYVSVYEIAYDAAAMWHLLEGQFVQLEKSHHDGNETTLGFAKLLTPAFREALDSFDGDIRAWASQIDPPCPQLDRSVEEYDRRLTELQQAAPRLLDLPDTLEDLQSLAGSPSGPPQGAGVSREASSRQEVALDLRTGRRQARYLSESCDGLCRYLLPQIGKFVQELGDVARPGWGT